MLIMKLNLNHELPSQTIAIKMRRFKQNKPKIYKSMLEEVREDRTPRNKKSITPIQESENEEDNPRPNMRNKRTTTLFTNDIGLYEEDSISDVSGNRTVISYVKKTNSKESKSPARRSSNQSKEFKRVSTFKSDGSNRGNLSFFLNINIGSQRFKFRQKIGK